MREPAININSGLAGRKPDELVVASEDAAPIIEQLLGELERSLTPLHYTDNRSGNGAVGIVAERAGKSRGFHNEEAAARRLYDLREQNSSSVSLDWYEAYLIAFDHHLDDFDLPVFPGGKQAAQDMVDVHAEDWPELDKKRLERSLWNFTRGYFTANVYEKRLAVWREAVEEAVLLDNIAPTELVTSRWMEQKKKRAA